MTIIRMATLVSIGVLMLSCGDSNGTANCDAFCNVAEECGGQDQSACVSECLDDATIAEEVSAACLDAFASLNGCVGGLTCPQAEAWLDEVPPDSYPCRNEDLAIEEDCFR
ncbi:MAG: hypothetical protein WBG86_17685 [Polyangiales bacterium]